jgi:hypothetical protein
MRDRNLPSPEQFNIQLRKVLYRLVSNDDRFSRTPVSDSPTLLNSEYWTFSYPKDFRSLRALSIVQWYLPEFLHWRIWMDLDEMNLNWLNRKQKVVIKLLLSSEINCKTYLYETQSFSSEELFGNILRTDVKDALRSTKYWRKKYRLVPIVYRRGYRDKGVRKPDHEWLPKEDYSLQEYMNDLEKERILTNNLLQRLLEILERDSKFRRI